MQPFDIVIPYLPNESKELEYCINFIAKNLPYRNIRVITEYEDSKYSGISHINQILKIKWAIEHYDLTENFYLMNDDFFILKPIKEVPYYHKGTLLDQYAKTTWLPYKQAIKTTINYLGIDALSYEMHMPMLLNTKKTKELIEKLVPTIESGSCPLIRSTYGNLYKVGGKKVEDVKNPKDYKHRTFLSTNEITFNTHIGKFIRDQL